MPTRAMSSIASVVAGIQVAIFTTASDAASNEIADSGFATPWATAAAAFVIASSLKYVIRALSVVPGAIRSATTGVRNKIGTTPGR